MPQAELCLFLSNWCWHQSIEIAMGLNTRLIDRAAQELSKTPLIAFIGALQEKIRPRTGNIMVMMRVSHLCSRYLLTLAALELHSNKDSSRHWNHRPATMPWYEPSSRAPCCGGPRNNNNNNINNNDEEWSDGQQNNNRRNNHRSSSDYHHEQEIISLHDYLDLNWQHVGNSEDNK